MIFKRPSVMLAMALALATPALAPAQYTLNLRDADIRAFIQDVAKVTGRNLIIDSRVNGKVTVVTDRSLSRSEYFEVFLSTLRANGLIAVPIAGGGFRIQPSDTAATQPGRVGSAGASRNAFVTEIFRLRSIEAASAVETLRPLVSREGSVTANRNGNSLVVADYADNIRRIRTLLQRIDSDGAATELILMRNAGAREIATSLQQLATGGQSGGDAARNAIAIVAIDSSNSIALRGDRGVVARFAALARDLDKRAASGTEIRVIWLQHADAEKLLPVLQQLVGQAVTTSPIPTVASGSNGATPSPAPAVAVSSVAPAQTGTGRPPAIITRYEGANAIVISADTQRTLGEVIRQLDTRREQVLVEAIIVEISDTAAKRLGIQLAVGGPNGGGFTTYSNVVPNIVAVAGGVLQDQLSGGTTTTTTVNGTTTTTTSGNTNGGELLNNALASVAQATGGTAGGAVSLGGNVFLGAIINAVKQDNQSNVLSTPSITTLDNQEAKFLVGQEIPITTGEQLGSNFENAFRTVQRQNVGIQLEVKPQINASGAIKLFIRQEVSSIAGPVSDRFSDLILNKREFETTLIVDDGQIAAIGGLLDDNERRTIEKIPFLGDLPAIGALFRSKAKSRAKTNLMVFIRPTILKTARDSAALAERRYGYIRDQQLDIRPDREPTIDELVRDYMGAAPPVSDPPPSAPLPAPPPR
jgi:general secretion pathway protein D